MNHETLKDKLFDLYDGELTGTQRQEVQTHLEGCEECRRAYTQWRQTAQAFFQAPTVETSEAFVHRVMERIEAFEEPQPAASWMRSIRWFVPALGFALLLLLVLETSQRPVSVEALLLGDQAENIPAQFVLESAPPTADQVLGFILEERS